MAEFYRDLIAYKHLTKEPKLPYETLAQSRHRYGFEVLVEEIPKSPPGEDAKGVIELVPFGSKSMVWGGALVVPCPEGYLVFRGPEGYDLLAKMSPQLV